MVGLGNVDNTSDLANQLYRNSISFRFKSTFFTNFTGTVSGIDKTLIGLGINNTSDLANQPVPQHNQI
jgi:hypothetical protein